MTATNRPLFLTKTNCPLCAKARVVLECIAVPAGVAWDEADIREDAVLFETYRHRVPVLRVGGHDVLYGTFRSGAVRRALGLARWPYRVFCEGLPELDGPLRAAGLVLVDSWEAGPDVAVLAAGRAGERPRGVAAPVVAIGGGAPGADAALQPPVYPPDLIEAIDRLCGP